MSTEIAIRNPIAIPPALASQGVTVTEEHGVRSVMIPPELKQRYNIAQPVSEVTQADPDWSPRLVVVDLSGEQYSYKEQGKPTLTKNGILLLAHAAGIDVDVEMIPRAQLRDTEIGYKATATIRRSDGTLAHWTASKVADLVDEEEATKTTNEKWPVVKKHLPAKTETKAILRAVALALQLKRGGYTVQDLQKPFLIVGVSSTPADPEVRRLRALEAGDALAGRRLPAPSVETHETSQYEEPTPAQQIAPAADVVDHVPASAVPASDEPDPGTDPVQGEIPADVQAAGEVVFPDGLRAAGKKVREVRREYIVHYARLEDESEPDLLTAACRVWLAWTQKQEAGVRS